MMRKPRPSGFTLLELITVIAMMSVLATLMTAVWFQVMDQWQVFQARTGLERRMQATFESMRPDFEMMLARGAGGEPLVGVADVQVVSEDAVGPVRTIEAPSHDSVTITTARPNAQGLLELERVTYRIDRPKEGEARLVRAKAVSVGGESTEAVGVVLMSPSELRIEYLDAGQWKMGWSEERLPEAVRVNLTAMVQFEYVRTYTKDEAISRSAEFRIHVR